MGANGNKLTQHEWINRCNEIHNNKYDYSKAIYINKRTKIKIICSVHEEFEQLAGSHIKGDGCKKCASTKDSLGKSMSFNNFIKKANIIHGNRYNYNINTFKNGKTKTEITCLTHGIFYQLPQSHLQGIGCKKCNMFNPPLTTMQFIQKAFIKHGNKYDYSLVNYSKSYEKVCIICPIHGKLNSKII